MSNTTLVISDLHLADGHTILDGFGDAQQAAFEGLTSAAGAAGPLGHADEIELVINGDCFDFLATALYDTVGITDMSTSLQMLSKIIASHTPFCEALCRFVHMPGRHVPFID